MRSILLGALIFITLGLSSSGCAPSRIMITGQVADRTGLPIVEAEVKTEPNTDIVFTDDNGFYYLTKAYIGDSIEETPIKPGSYVIIIKKEGYESLKIPVVVESGKEKVPKQLMKKEAKLIEDVAPTKLKEENRTGAGGDLNMGI